MSGTVNVARDLWDDPTFKDSEMSQREAWIWMIAEASWKDRDRRVGAHEVALKRGQFAASTRFMAGAFMWSEARVRRYLDMLENRRMIRRETDAGVTVVTICNYDNYQNKPSSGDADATQQPTHQRRTSDANENKGEIREEYIGGGGGARAREAGPASLANPTDPTLRERILAACGVDPSGLTGHGGRMIGKAPEMAEITSRMAARNLTDAEVLQVVRETMLAKREPGPPSSLRFFLDPLDRYAAARDAPVPQLSPATPRPSSRQPTIAEMTAMIRGTYPAGAPQ
ncbi:hypothetical protein [Gemmobacter denitrificans]|uniref:Helix-turn-helix DNA binding domain protein n=1 Tax=Gemmobacter denitrificans TaxID=3123040 RepID=A0ABU8BTV4_9RHOB